MLKQGKQRPIDPPDKNEELKSHVIANISVPQEICSILKDVIVVDLNFTLVRVSFSILKSLEYSLEEVSGKSMNYIAGGFDLVSAIKKISTAGYLPESPANLYSKSGYMIPVRISGFYFTSMNEINSHLLLQIKPCDERGFINTEIKDMKVSLDNFIYRTAHDIRGPLATIQGLINLLKIRKDNTEVDRLLQMIDAHATKLDERLFQLVYLAQVDDEEKIPENSMNFTVLETNLRKVIEQNAFIDFLELHFTSTEKSITGVNEILITSLLTNILLYLLSLPKHGFNNQISFHFKVEARHLKIMIHSNGIVMEESMKKGFPLTTSLYTDILKYPRLVNFFAAQKLASKLRSDIQIDFLSGKSQNITMCIPIETNLSSTGTTV